MTCGQTHWSSQAAQSGSAVRQLQGHCTQISHAARQGPPPGLVHEFAGMKLLPLSRMHNKMLVFMFREDRHVHDLQNSATLVKLQGHTASMQPTGASTRRWWPGATAGAAPRAGSVGLTADVKALLRGIHMLALHEEGCQSRVSFCTGHAAVCSCLSSSF